MIVLMRALILYRPRSEHEGKVLDYVHEYQIRHPDRQLELVSLDTINGDQMARLYDVVSYPAILITAPPDGQLVQLWQDEQFPLMDDIDFYLQ